MTVGDVLAFHKPGARARFVIQLDGRRYRCSLSDPGETPAYAATRPLPVEVQPLTAVDLAAAPREIIIPAVAAQLAALASQIDAIRDISVDMQLSKDGVGSLKFRAYGRF